MNASFSIRVVSKRTGLSPHLIRAWERRYGVIQPNRTEGGHRGYTEEQVRRLELMGRVVRSGMSIGSVAQLPESELMAILSRREEAERRGGFGEGDLDPSRDLIRRMMGAVTELDARELNRVLDEGKVALGWQGLMERVISPAAERVGHLWVEGEMSVAQEHFFTAAVKFHLGARVQTYSQVRQGPRIVVATPVGQMHELGAVLSAHAAATLGWEVAYLGPGLSAGELAGALKRFGARVLALSVIFPADDEGLRADFRALGHLAPKARILAGGPALKSYADTFAEIGGVACDTLGAFCSALEQIRREEAERFAAASR
jgi:DNA-binding transcriptional MerR regulator